MTILLLGTSEAEEIVDYLSGGSDLAVVTEDEDEARRSTANVLVRSFVF